MRTLDIRGVLRRRWYVLVAGLLVTAALAVAAYTVVGVSREIKASALLLPPATSVVGYPDRAAPGNPFLRLDGMDPALSVLITKLASEEMSDRILSDAPQTTYKIDEDPLSQAPIIVVTASGKNAAEAGRVLDRVTTQIPLTLNELQDEAEVRPQARITLVPLVRDEEMTVVWSQLLRLEILIIGVGMVATLLLTGLWDAIVRSRTARGEVPKAESRTSPIDPERRIGAQQKPTDSAPELTSTERKATRPARKQPSKKQEVTDPAAKLNSEKVRAEKDRDGWTGRTR